VWEVLGLKPLMGRRGDGRWALSLRIVGCLPRVTTKSAIDEATLVAKKSCVLNVRSCFSSLRLACHAFGLSAPIRCVREHTDCYNPLDWMLSTQVVVALGTFCCNTGHCRPVVFCLHHEISFFHLLVCPRDLEEPAEDVTESDLPGLRKRVLRGCYYSTFS